MGLLEIKENRIKRIIVFIKSFIRVLKKMKRLRGNFSFFLFFFFRILWIRISMKLNNGYNAMEIDDKYLLSGVSVISIRKFVRFV